VKIVAQMANKLENELQQKNLKVLNCSKVVKIYEWDIPDFVNRIQGSCNEGPMIRIPETTSGAVDWKLWIRCEKDTDLWMNLLKQPTTRDSSGSIADSQTQVFFTICLVCPDENIESCEKILCDRVPSFKVVKWGFSRYLVKCDMLLHEPERYLTDGKLTVLYTVHVFIYQ